MRVHDSAPAPATLVVVCADFAFGGVIVFAAGDAGRQVTERQSCDSHKPLQRVATFILPAGAYRVRFYDMDTFRPGGPLAADDLVELTEGRELRWNLHFTQRGEPYPRTATTSVGF